MKKALILLLLILNIIVTHAQTEITTTEVVGVWKQAGSPYIINNDITISTGTLTIEPGVVINFNGNYSVTISGVGNIKALGEKTNKITFSANSTWAGIRFLNLEVTADSSLFENCTIQRCTKIYNSFSDAGVPERDGGAIFINSFGKIRFENCTIKNNKSSAQSSSSTSGYVYGGGMFLLNAPIKMINCDISNNSALYSMGTYGGGIYMKNSDVEFIGCKISSNRSSAGYYGRGGGIYMDNSSPAIVNCIINDNSCSAPNSPGCSSYGGGICMYNSLPEVYNSTVVYNSTSYSYNTDGGGIYFTSSSSADSFQAYNSIFWGNTSYGSSDQLEGNAKIYNCCIENTTTKTKKTDCISSDPLFNKVYNKDYSLKSSSPCINTGNNTYIQYSTDFNSNPRVVDDNVDIGAYEYLPSYTVTFKDWDGTLIEQQTITYGNAAIAPKDPVRDGFVFVGWDSDFNNIVSDVEIIAEYSITTLVIDSSTSNYRCYPNPVNDILYIDLPQTEGVVSVEVFNAIGDILYTKRTEEDCISINTSFIKKGILIIKLSRENNIIFTQKIVKY